MGWWESCHAFINVAWCKWVMVKMLKGQRLWRSATTPPLLLSRHVQSQLSSSYAGTIPKRKVGETPSRKWVKDGGIFWQLRSLELLQPFFGIRKASPWPSPLFTGQAEAHSDLQEGKRKTKEIQSQAVKAQADKRSCSKLHLMSTSSLLWHQKHRQVLYGPSEITYPGITSCHEGCLVP